VYQVCANIHDVGIISVPLQIEAPAENLKGLKPDLPLPSFQIVPQEVRCIDTEAQIHRFLRSLVSMLLQILNAVTASTKVIFLCSPGNPTANVLRLKDVEAILNSEVSSSSNAQLRKHVVSNCVFVRSTEVQGLCGG
jgi:histidinol-phosphate aminotransferase